MQPSQNLNCVLASYRTEFGLKTSRNWCLYHTDLVRENALNPRAFCFLGPSSPSSGTPVCSPKLSRAEFCCMTIPAAMNSLRKGSPEPHRISGQHHGVLTPAADVMGYPKTIGAADLRDVQRSWWLQIHILRGNNDDCSHTTRKDGNDRPLWCQSVPRLSPNCSSACLLILILKAKFVLLLCPDYLPFPLFFIAHVYCSLGSRGDSTMCELPTPT